MGSGDWNDGMNRVGNGGEGESVWLGFFLAHILKRFVPIAEARDDRQRADATARTSPTSKPSAQRRRLGRQVVPPRLLRRRHAARLRHQRRVPHRRHRAGLVRHLRRRAGGPRASALDAVDQHLVDERAGIIRLLTPPFDLTGHDPGYIKGYLPGVRENGGQYTHGVLWAVRAFAEGGRHDRAAELLRMILPVNHARTPAAADAT